MGKNSGNKHTVNDEMFFKLYQSVTLFKFIMVRHISHCFKLSSLC